jgi:hypothetical protein
MIYTSFWNYFRNKNQFPYVILYFITLRTARTNTEELRV